MARGYEYANYAFTIMSESGEHRLALRRYNKTDAGGRILETAAIGDANLGADWQEAGVIGYVFATKDDAPGLVEVHRCRYQGYAESLFTAQQCAAISGELLSGPLGAALP